MLPAAVESASSIGDTTELREILITRSHDCPTQKTPLQRLPKNVKRPLISKLVGADNVGM